MRRRFPFFEDKTVLTRRLEDLTLADIERLTENGITESNYLDFKSAPVGNSDRERKETTLPSASCPIFKRRC
jgi:hypothetical protein